MIQGRASIAHISPVLLAAFAFMLEHPDSWWPAERVAQASGSSETTIYRRFGNLVHARVLEAKRLSDFRHFRLRPDWQDSQLGQELHRRARKAGLLKVAAAPD